MYPPLSVPHAIPNPRPGAGFAPPHSNLSATAVAPRAAVGHQVLQAELQRVHPRGTATASMCDSRANCWP